MRWKLCLVVTPKDVKYLNQAIKYFGNKQFATEGVHVVCGKDVQVPNVASVARTRATEPLTEAETWLLAIDTLSKAYASTEDLFLFATPDLVFWDIFQLFCEESVERDFVSVYLPFSPIRYFVDSAHKAIPCHSNEPAWCETAIDEPTNACRSLLVGKHSCRLLATYLNDTIYKDPTIPPRLWDWPNLFYTAVYKQYKMHCYAAVPSLAESRASFPVSFVANTATKLRGFRRGSYLN